MNLWRLTRDQLLEAGLPDEGIFGLDLCTASMPDSFFSVSARLLGILNGFFRTSLHGSGALACGPPSHTLSVDVAISTSCESRFSFLGTNRWGGGGNYTSKGG